MREYVFKYNPKQYPITFTNSYFDDRIQEAKDLSISSKVLIYLLLLNKDHCTKHPEFIEDRSSRTYHDILRLMWGHGDQINPAFLIKYMFKWCRAVVTWDYCFDPALSYVFNICWGNRSEKLSNLLFDRQYDKFSQLADVILSKSTPFDTLASTTHIQKQSRVIWSFPTADTEIKLNDLVQIPDKYKIHFINPSIDCDKAPCRHWTYGERFEGILDLKKWFDGEDLDSYTIKKESTDEYICL